MIEAFHIHVRGVVQGVGFRPFVYKLAKKYLINGWVLNNVEGVTIHAEGETKCLDEFVLEISEHHPSAAHVEEIELAEVPLEQYESFEIRFSDESEAEVTTLISPDLATCPDCVDELFNPNNRRYRYPFINCTNCGPRFTIIEDLPYDRAQTSMKDFPLCIKCQAEYDDPADRRFHAQPNACETCGPVVTWYEPDPAQDAHATQTPGSAATKCPKNGEMYGFQQLQKSPSGKTQSHDSEKAENQYISLSLGQNSPTHTNEVFEQATKFLREGKIVAIKGLGGFHLACDANNEHAVAELRCRKKREGKPFAVMMRDINQVREYCQVNAAEEELLTGSVRPIVLLKKRPGAQFVPGLADHLPELGVMLPYTPVQHLLMHDFPGVIVMTSGNLHDEPIVTRDEEAHEKLASIADGFLGNNRPIRARYDDSVVRIIQVGGKDFAQQVVRRARGYAPLPIPIPNISNQAPSVFATGPEQKNTFTLTRGAEAFVSQHIGDMENAETYDAWLATKATYERLFEIEPTQIACDLHPEYLTTKWAAEQAQQRNIPITQVQHHYAHIAAVMAENNLEPPVCGFAFDGTGYGMDGSIWGGEVLLCNYQTFERFANFAYVPMPGGAAAIKNPARMAYGALWAFDLLEHPAAQDLINYLGKEADLCGQMIEKGLNTPYTSSLGRLFDAAAALLNVCRTPQYEGEPAILLEAALADKAANSTLQTAGSYPFELVKNTANTESTAQDTSVLLVDFAPTFKAVLDDMQNSVPVSTIVRRFHNAVIEVMVQLAQLIEATYDLQAFALSGGVFLNRYLVEQATQALTAAGYTVALNNELPPSDGCISYGQAVVALHQEDERK